MKTVVSMLCMVVALCSCGGTGDGSASPLGYGVGSSPVKIEQPAMEYDDCANVPTEVLFNYDGTQINRFENYGSGPVNTGYKNPEHDPLGGPATGRNCTMKNGVAVYTVNPNDVQTVSYSFKTENYFDVLGVSDHFPTVTRGYLYRVYGGLPPDDWQSGIGTALYGDLTNPPYQGLFAEHFSTIIVSEANFIPHDGVWYNISIETHSYGEVVEINDGWKGGYWTFSWVSPAVEEGAGWAIGIIFQNNASMNGFELHVTNLQVSWDWLS